MPSSGELGTLHNKLIRTTVRPIPIHTTRRSCLYFRTLALGAYHVPYAALAIALDVSALRIRGKVVERLAVQGPLQCIVVAPHDVDVRGIARAFFHQVRRPCGGAAATSPLLGDFFCSATARLQVICRRTLLSPDFYMLPREGSENTTTHLRRRGRQGTHRARATADGQPASMSGSVSQYASSSRQQQSSVASV
jgi:hypothetical protein